jgi:hypothetical protein
LPLLLKCKKLKFHRKPFYVRSSDKELIAKVRAGEVDKKQLERTGKAFGNLTNVSEDKYP